jgi:hypothetical protein
LNPFGPIRRNLLPSRYIQELAKNPLLKLCHFTARRARQSYSVSKM